MDDDHDSHASNGRGKSHLPNGKFAPGNRCSPGNPNALKQFRLRQEILNSASASPGAVRIAFARLFRRAIGKTEDKDGSSIDIEAMRLYLSYVVGRPTQALEISGPDGSELPDLGKIRDAILNAVGDDWAVRSRIARALLDLGSGERDEPERPVGP